MRIAKRIVCFFDFWLCKCAPTDTGQTRVDARWAWELSGMFYGPKP